MNSPCYPIWWTEWFTLAYWEHIFHDKWRNVMCILLSKDWSLHVFFYHWNLNIFVHICTMLFSDTFSLPYSYIYIYATPPPPRDLPFQNVLVPLQGDMTTRFSLRWSAYLHNYSPPRTCTLNLVGLTCIEVTSLVAERFVVIQDCFLEYSSSCYIVSIEVFFLNKII